MMRKTHRTAVVIIPPQEIWEPIQSIREKYDPHFRRWMPHINLIYPFCPAENFADYRSIFQQILRQFSPFLIELATFKSFEHKRQKFTIWLSPEPREPLQNLQQQLVKIVPEYDDVNRFKGGFTPHLSVGQVRGRSALKRLIENLQKDWRPLRFMVDRIYFIGRGDPPDDIFKIVAEIPFGKD